jgi:hypothetical protein
MKQHTDLGNAVEHAVARATAAGRSATVNDLFDSLLHVSEVDRMVRGLGADHGGLASALQADAGEARESGFFRSLRLRAVPGDARRRRKLSRVVLTGSMR